MQTIRCGHITKSLACLTLTVILSACKPDVAVSLITQEQISAAPTTTADSTESVTILTEPVSATPSALSPTANSSATPRGSSTQAATDPTAPAVSLPVPCKSSSGSEIYLSIEGQRRHIVDWYTFLDLGYQQTDITDCGEAVALPEGERITYIFKGSGDAVYALLQGVRHQIPNMTTFMAMGLEIADISILPDDVIALWPLAEPVPAISPDSAVQVYTIGAYTIHVWQAVWDRIPYTDSYNFATISAPDQPFTKIKAFQSIVSLPVADITGEGNPDVVFHTRWHGGRCCSGTVVYDLGPTPVKVLHIDQQANMTGGRGEFRDFDGDGIFEFVTDDQILMGRYNDNTCIWVTSVLAYSADQRTYVGASSQLASSAYYEDHLAELRALSRPTSACHILVATLLYIGRIDEARATFDELYNGTDPEGYWTSLNSAVQQAQFYVSGQ